MKTPKKLLPFVVSIVLAHAAPALAEPIQAGVTAAVRGDIEVLSFVEGSERLAKSGEEIYLGDSINSRDNAGMQLMLLDETVFTVGANTEFTVDEFVYDPATGIGNVTASLAKGVLRFVTGNIAQGDPDDMVINLPAGTIGIRGTFGVAVMDGDEALVILLGPGDANNAGARIGALEVTSGGETVGLTQPQFGTRIAPGLPPTLPFLLSPEEIAGIMAALESQPEPEESEDSEDDGNGGGDDEEGEGGGKGEGDGDGDGGGEGGAAGLAGQSLADGGLFADGTQSLGDLSGGLTATGDEGLLTISGILDGLTTYDQLRSIQTGTAFYTGAGTFIQTLQNGSPVSKVGTFSFVLDVDFGARTTGGGTSVISVTTPGNISDSALITSASYTDDFGLVTGVLDASDFADNSSICFVCFAGTQLALFNAGGVIASELQGVIRYSNGADVGSGAVTAPGVFSAPQ